MTNGESVGLLESFGGMPPPAPTWFVNAQSLLPERRWHDVQGARIETLSWGTVGSPGLLLLHGQTAHADWWSFIAPFFAKTHRVTALSWSGMGGSDWREQYSIDIMAEEARVVARAEGLFESVRRPVFVCHSFGAMAGLRCAELYGEQLGGVLAVDMPLRSPGQLDRWKQSSESVRPAERPTRVYPSLASALARFRFSPEQDCQNLYIVDHIARKSLREVPLPDAPGTGWTWRFDPRVTRLSPGDPVRSLANAACPIAISWGSESTLVTPKAVSYVASLVRPGTPQFAIPEARHHVMADEPLAFVASLNALLQTWPSPS